MPLIGTVLSFPNRSAIAGLAGSPLRRASGED